MSCPWTTCSYHVYIYINHVNRDRKIWGLTILELASMFYIENIVKNNDGVSYWLSYFILKINYKKTMVFYTQINIKPRWYFIGVNAVARQNSRFPSLMRAARVIVLTLSLKDRSSLATRQIGCTESRPTPSLGTSTQGNDCTICCFNMQINHSYVCWTDVRRIRWVDSASVPSRWLICLATVQWLRPYKGSP